MRLVFAGTPDVAVPSLTALIGSRHEVVAVLTRPDSPTGRGRTTAPSPIRVAAEQAGIEVLTPRRPRDPDFLQRLRDLAPDCCPVVAYGGLIPPAVLAVPRRGWVNLHFSLLPAWRGAAPVQHAIIAGDTETGATVFVLEEGLDTGPVLGTMVEALRPTDTAGHVLGRLSVAGAPLLVAALDAIADGTAVAVPQPADGVSHAPKLTPADARIDFTRPAHEVDRRIRGCTPEPGAWTVWGDVRIKLDPVTVVPGEALPAGVVRVSRSGVLVGTATSAVRLGVVGQPGRRPMPAADWARGARDLDGSVLAAAADLAGRVR